MSELCSRFGLMLSLAVVAGLAGCDKKRDFGEHVKTYPALGTVTVDGQPVTGILVVAHPTEKTRTSANPSVFVPETVSAFTDDKGHFSIGTYEKGDGIPAGEYSLTFLWGRYDLMSGMYGKPDKLKGHYQDPQKSEIRFTVDPSKSTDLGTITLTTVGTSAKKK